MSSENERDASTGASTSLRIGALCQVKASATQAQGQVQA